MSSFDPPERIELIFPLRLCPENIARRGKWKPRPHRVGLASWETFTHGGILYTLFASVVNLILPAQPTGRVTYTNVRRRYGALKPGKVAPFWRSGI
jgi:hypothetical protein